MQSSRECTRHAGASGLALALAAALAFLPAAPAGAAMTVRGRAAQQTAYLALAANGAAQAMTAFRDDSHGIWNGRRNVPLRWYDERLGVHTGYPLATIWGAVPLFDRCRRPDRGCAQGAEDVCRGTAPAAGAAGRARGFQNARAHARDRGLRRR